MLGRVPVQPRLTPVRRRARRASRAPVAIALALAAAAATVAALHGHSVTQTALRIVIFDRQHQVIGLLRSGANQVFGEGLDAVSINDRDGRPLVFQLVCGL